MLKYSLTPCSIPAKSHTSLGKPSVTNPIPNLTAQAVSVVQYSAQGIVHHNGAVISNRLVTLNNNHITYAPGLVVVTDPKSNTVQWYRDSHNISSSIQAWLDHLGYTWPLTKDQQAHFILTFV